MALSKEVADLQAAVQDAAARSVTTSKSFQDQIAALKAQVAAGGLSQEDHDALVALVQVAKGIDPTDTTTVSPPQINIVNPPAPETPPAT